MTYIDFKKGGDGKTTATVDTTGLGTKIQELKDTIYQKRLDAENLRKEIDGLNVELAKLLAVKDQLPQ